MIETDFGGLDILVNNAAILRMKNIEDETLAGWQRIQSVNQDSVFLGIKYALPLMARSGGGSIINMSSSSALMGLPNFVAYSAGKATVRGLTQTIAVHCHKQNNGVRCNSIHADGINTPMIAELQMPQDAMSEEQAIHFHVLFLDGVYVHRDNRSPWFRRVRAPDKGELEDLVQLISRRVGRCLERQGLLEQDAESAWLEFDPVEDTDAMPQILGSSVSYRIAVGPQQGRKVVYTLKTPKVFTMGRKIVLILYYCGEV